MSAVGSILQPVSYPEDLEIPFPQQQVSLIILISSWLPLNRSYEEEDTCLRERDSVSMSKQILFSVDLHVNERQALLRSL